MMEGREKKDEGGRKGKPWGGGELVDGQFLDKVVRSRGLGEGENAGEAWTVDAALELTRLKRAVSTLLREEQVGAGL